MYEVRQHLFNRREVVALLLDFDNTTAQQHDLALPLPAPLAQSASPPQPAAASPTPATSYVPPQTRLDVTRAALVSYIATKLRSAPNSAHMTFCLYAIRGRGARAEDVVEMVAPAGGGAAGGRAVVAALKALDAAAYPYGDSLPQPTAAAAAAATTTATAGRGAEEDEEAYSAVLQRLLTLKAMASSAGSDAGGACVVVHGIAVRSRGAAAAGLFDTPSPAPGPASGTTAADSTVWLDVLSLDGLTSVSGRESAAGTSSPPSPSLRSVDVARRGVRCAVLDPVELTGVKHRGLALGPSLVRVMAVPEARTPEFVQRPLTLLKIFRTVAASADAGCASHPSEQSAASAAPSDMAAPRRPSNSSTPPSVTAQKGEGSGDRDGAAAAGGNSSSNGKHSGGGAGAKTAAAHGVDNHDASHPTTTLPQLTSSAGSLRGVKSGSVTAGQAATTVTSSTAPTATANTTTTTTTPPSLTGRTTAAGVGAARGGVGESESLPAVAQRRGSTPAKQQQQQQQQQGAVRLKARPAPARNSGSPTTPGGAPSSPAGAGDDGAVARQEASSSAASVPHRYHSSSPHLAKIDGSTAAEGTHTTSPQQPLPSTYGSKPQYKQQPQSHQQPQHLSAPPPPSLSSQRLPAPTPNASGSSPENSAHMRRAATSDTLGVTPLPAPSTTGRTAGTVGVTAATTQAPLRAAAARQQQQQQQRNVSSSAQHPSPALTLKPVPPGYGEGGPRTPIGSLLAEGPANPRGASGTGSAGVLRSTPSPSGTPSRVVSAGSPVFHRPPSTMGFAAAAASTTTRNQARIRPQPDTQKRTS